MRCATSWIVQKLAVSGWNNITFFAPTGRHTHWTARSYTMVLRSGISVHDVVYMGVTQILLDVNIAGCYSADSRTIIPSGVEDVIYACVIKASLLEHQVPLLDQVGQVVKGLNKGSL